MKTNRGWSLGSSKPLWIAASLLVALGWSLAAPGLGQVPVMHSQSQVSIPPPGFSWGWDRADSVAIGNDGRFIVTWSYPYGPSVCSRRSYGSLGNPEGLPAPVTDTSAGWLTDVARDASGRYVIVWRGNDGNVWGRRFGSDGNPLGDEFQASTSSDGSGFPHVASDPAGNFVVAWTAGGSADHDVLARLFDSQGVPRGAPFPVNAFTNGSQDAGGAAMAPDGHFVVSWGGVGQTGDGAFARLFDSSGTPTTGDIQVNSAGPVHSLPDVSIDAAGRTTVVWNGDVVSGRRLDSAGTPTGPVFPISDSASYYSDARVAANSTGNFLVTWGYGAEITGRLHDPSGAAVGPEFVVGGFSDQYRAPFDAHASMADDGSFVVAWTQGYYANLNDFRYDVWARKSGLRAIGAGVYIPTASQPGAAPDVTSNGVLEPGETMVFGTAWANESADAVALAGMASGFSGPPGASYTVDDATADYGTIPAGDARSCANGGNDCYRVTVSAPAVRPAQHWDALLQEALSVGVPKTWQVHIGESFPDVPADNLFYKSIETVFHSGVIVGCAGGGYCPSDPVTRGQMAVFLLRSKFGSAHVPPPCTGAVFTDVSCAGQFDPWIEELSALGITGGCGGGLYCPSNTVTRGQMAVLLLKTREGSAYNPPDCAGIFADVPCTPGEGFSDWIEELRNRSITGGCSASPLEYCPTNASNRGQMAALLSKTFGLVLYGGR